MSLTNIVYTPVDTGMANVSKEWDNPNLKDFYLLTGKSTPIGLLLRRYIQGSVILTIFWPHPPSPSPVGEEAVLQIFNKLLFYHIS